MNRQVLSPDWKSEGVIDGKSREKDKPNEINVKEADFQAAAETVDSNKRVTKSKRSFISCVTIMSTCQSAIGNKCVIFICTYNSGQHTLRNTDKLTIENTQRQLMTTP